MRLCSIASGSDGNCVYIGSEKNNILVDVGISKKRVEEGLRSIDVDPESISAILITHEHIDHVSGLGVISRKYNVPIYGTRETLDALAKIKSLGKISADLFKYIEPDENFDLLDIQVEAFSTYHDAVNPVGYALNSGEQKIGIATDLGKYDDYIIEKLQGSDILFIESNHDENMLLVGNYPYYLKQRILSDYGHLSNDLSANLISRLLNGKSQYITLAHLSKENNYDELAYETIFSQLTMGGCDFSNIVLNVAKKDGPSDLIAI